MIVSGLNIHHPEGVTEGKVSQQEELDGMFATVAESSILGSTDYQILTRKSGFAKIREENSVQLYDLLGRN